MRSITIYHHLGLGDHFVCNGLVNHVAKSYDKVKLICKATNYPTVKALYGDSVDLLPVEGDAEANKIQDNTLRVGFEQCNPFKWERSFYEQLRLPYELRWTEFKIKTTPSMEIVNTIKEEEFALVALNASTGKVNISPTTNLPIVEVNPQTNSLLDWIPVMEKAKEIHCIDSSVYHLVSQLDLNVEKYYYLGRKTNSPSEVNLGWKLRS